MGAGVAEMLGIAAAAFGVGLSGAMMPGPVLAVTLANLDRAGAKAGPLVTLGHGIVEGALVLGLALGAGSFLERDGVTGAIALGGACVLLWMGWGMIAQARAGGGVPGEAQGERRTPGPVAGGALASLSNPYWYLWWATVGFGSVAVSKQWGAAGIAAFFTGHIASDLAWLSAVSLALSKGRRLMSERAYARALAGLGCFLIFFSVLFFAFGVDKLFLG